MLRTIFGPKAERKQEDGAKYIKTSFLIWTIYLISSIDMYVACIREIMHIGRGIYLETVNLTYNIRDLVEGGRTESSGTLF